jgi:transcriptional regulator with XRE-family HTH domain
MKKKIRSAFYRLRTALGLKREAVAELCGVSLRTITNWDRDGAPETAMAVLRLSSRDLGAFHPDWRGFTIGRNGKLYGPDRLQISAEHLRHYPAFIRQLERLEAEAHRQKQPTQPATLADALKTWIKTKL